MTSAPAWNVLVQLLALAVPAVFAAAGLAAPRRAVGACVTALGLVGLLGAAMVAAPDVAPSADGVGAWLAGAVRVDALGAAGLALVAGLSVVVARYSEVYLAGDPGLDRYRRWLMATLAGVTTVIVAADLGVLVLGWIATSLTLHPLLTHFADRDAAQLAAHKKFLASRLADLALLGCLALVRAEVGSLGLVSIEGWVRTHPGLTPEMHGAAVLLVVAVALRSAQLPFHGWLIQVMEAPTPVSALLHAGVVNVGGFVLLRLAPWVAEATIARALLVAIGLVSTVVAARIMTTRVSIKVALAWSTCAQLGFMLVELGLGAWSLALLHLLAHSLYKAHAFLAAGSTVEAWRARAWAPVQAQGQGPGARMGTPAAAVLTVAGISAALLATARVGWGALDGGASTAVVGGLVGAAALVLLAAPGRAPRGSAAGRARGAAGLVAAYVAAHALVTALVPAPPTPVDPVGWSWVGIVLLGAFALDVWVRANPDAPPARALQRLAFAGLHLDERFTRLTFRVWPPRLAPRAPAGEGRVADALQGST
jgi:NAD(P)H-quinone oxidoreductase subunit 5